jgi:HAD superfamily hydrolase (TIGR01459 family)
MSKASSRSALSLMNVIGSYRGVILDLFGVLHDGVALYPYTVETLAKLRARGIRTCLLSNSPRRSHSVAARLASMGIGHDLYQGLITSGEMVYQAFAGANRPVEFKFNRFFHVGPTELSGLLEGVAVKQAIMLSEADFILATGSQEEGAGGPDTSLLLAGQIRKLPMVCANPDLEVYIGSRKVVCAGTVASLYEAQGGHVIRYGKPCSSAYIRALQLLDLSVADVLAVGDSIATDILGANRMGIDSALVMTGIHQDYAADGAPLDWQRLEQLWQLQGAEPTFVLKSLL